VAYVFIIFRDILGLGDNCLCSIITLICQQNFKQATTNFWQFNFFFLEYGRP